MSVGATASRPVSDHGKDDVIVPFAVTPLDVRGRIVRLGPALDQILSRHEYPPEIARLTGEAVALTVLLGSALKGEGRFQLQTRSQGVVTMIVVDYEAPGHLRAYAQFDPIALEAAREANNASAAQLLGYGHLAFTIEQSATSSRYQGVVALEGQGFEEAAHQYFQQSEQIPTRVRLAVGEQLMPGGAGQNWRAGGALVQFLPDSPDRQRAVQREQATPAGFENPADEEGDDAWNEALALAGSIEDHELLDPVLSSERLLYRLFNQRGVTVFETAPVRHVCRCDRDRMIAMLKQFTHSDLQHMIGDDGQIGVTCEFCSTSRTFDPADFGLSPQE
ncbi:MAG: Hsp33 family molecular chaperone [Beijerinckiaceae bacterium]|jgi:molecular chaperone Hsp33|nr:Hsp33 family molecular chaperone [Beijerinckiaceae bacterium]